VEQRPAKYHTYNGVESVITALSFIYLQGQIPLNIQDQLHLAALLHDIGKFRRRAIGSDISHQEHSYAFVNSDFSDFFAPCGDFFKAAIRHHHPEGDPPQLQHLIQKQLILADRLSAIENESEETEIPALVSIFSTIKGADKKHYYKPTALSFEPDTIIPTDTINVDQAAYESLWKEFKDAFGRATADKPYKPKVHYQTIVALLHKYTSRMPSEPADSVDSDISLYDHLRTTAALAACIGRELTNETDIDERLNGEGLDKPICALIKGDLSGIQDFLYHILSEGASNQLRGRSFYLQLLTEAIAHKVLRRLDLPVTNLILASGGHFYIIAPYTDTECCMPDLCKEVSQRLWRLHDVEPSCILDYAPVAAADLRTQNLANKWAEVSDNVQQGKQQKWTEMGDSLMFQNLFKPDEKKKDTWKFDDLGKKLRKDPRVPAYLITFEVPESDIPPKPTWHDALKAFGMEICICEDTGGASTEQTRAERATAYRLGSTDFLTEEAITNFQWNEVSYDFRLFRPVIAYTKDGTIADYDELADASEGVGWLGALRMDVDDLGDVFIHKLENATISRLATLSEALCLFFEGYVPQLCHQYNVNQYNVNKNPILELIYAGGDDLFLIGGWSALPDIVEQIRTKFYDFVTGNHVTLSGGIAIEHKKYPIYQFAHRSDEAEKAAKNYNYPKKNAITFLRKTMSWEDFRYVTEWHKKFLDALKGQNQLPRDILTRLSQIYSEKELKEHRWGWRSIYYFHRLLERNKSQAQFIHELRCELNNSDGLDLKTFIQIITRWTALRIRN